jgi:hypothetical protein
LYTSIFINWHYHYRKNCLSEQEASEPIVPTAGVRVSKQPQKAKKLHHVSLALPVVPSIVAVYQRNEKDNTGTKKVTVKPHLLIREPKDFRRIMEKVRARYMAN